MGLINAKTQQARGGATLASSPLVPNTLRAGCQARMQGPVSVGYTKVRSLISGTDDERAGAHRPTGGAYCPPSANVAPCSSALDFGLAGKCRDQDLDHLQVCPVLGRHDPNGGACIFKVGRALVGRCWQCSTATWPDVPPRDVGARWQKCHIQGMGEDVTLWADKRSAWPET